MPRTKRPLTDSEDDVFVKHKATIRQLYEVERKTLKEIKYIMEHKHEFPETRLSTYETKLRDKLGLRKKLKKSDWAAVYQRQQNRQGKETGLYLNGTRIPWRKASKEIGRSGARSSDSPYIPLSAGVVVRTPSPIGPRTLPGEVSHQEEMLFSFQMPSSSPQSTSLLLQANQFLDYNLQETAQASEQGTFPVYESQIQRFVPGQVVESGTSATAIRSLGPVCIRTSTPSQRINAIFAESLKHGWVVTALSDLPCNQLIKRISAITNGTSWHTGYNSMLIDYGSDLNTSKSEGPPVPLISELLYDNEPLTSALSRYFDAHYFLARTMYMVSNNLMDFWDVDSIINILEILFHRIPEASLLTLLDSGVPTVRATWEFLAVAAGSFGSQDNFRFLMHIGLRHPRWILPDGHRHLSHAVAMGTIDIVQSLLKLGSRPDQNLISAEGQTQLAIMEAVAAENLQCLRLLLEKCDVNRPVHGCNRSNFGMFVSHLTGGKVRLFKKRCHKFPNGCFGGPGAWIHVALDVENEFQNLALNMFLEAGANVDSIADDIFIGYDLHQLYTSSRIAVRYHRTILDESYYSNRKVFWRLVNCNTKAKSHLTRAGICLSVKQGHDALSGYLASRRTDPGMDRTVFLELVLAEQFFMTNYVIDAKVVQGLVEYGVEPTLRSLNLYDNVLLLRLVVAVRNHGFDDDFATILAMLLRQGMVIDSDILGSAVEEEGIAILEILSRHGANIRKYGALAVSVAARLENYEAVSWLLQSGVDINAVVDIRVEQLSILAAATMSPDYWSTGRSPHYRLLDNRCLFPSSSNMLIYLLQHGAKLRKNPRDSTAFDFLAHFVHYNNRATEEILKSLQIFMDQGLQLHDLSNPKGCLLEACVSRYGIGKRPDGTLHVFEWLLDHGVPIKCNGVLPHLISLGARDELILKVLEAGVDINAYDINAYGHAGGPAEITAVQAAAYGGDKKLVAQLLQRGADINQLSGRSGWKITALQAACECRTRSAEEKARKMELITFLIDCGADVNAPAGFTPLHVTAHQGDMETAILLVRHRADPNTPGGYAGSVLDIAAGEGRLDMVQFLLNMGALSNVREWGSIGYDGAIRRAERYGFHAVAEVIRDFMAKRH
ncbi:hypothetical protein F5B20DRAFT_245803 [Whalleya microplaca]|nr:hypothetical protein F5B20DRAFT_245803 [Whalleya microplaca]